MHAYTTCMHAIICYSLPSADTCWHPEILNSEAMTIRRTRTESGIFNYLYTMAMLFFLVVIHLGSVYADQFAGCQTVTWEICWLPKSDVGNLLAEKKWRGRILPHHQEVFPPLGSCPGDRSAPWVGWLAPKSDVGEFSHITKTHLSVYKTKNSYIVFSKK